MDYTKEIIEKLVEKYEPKLERPWREYPDFVTAKDKLVDKWFALFMVVPADKLGLSGQEVLPVVNIKADTEFIQFIAGSQGILPGYHMNKEHWLTVLLDGTVPMERVLSMIDSSYQLITDTPAKRIYEAVKKVPRGKVATYSQIADLAGNPKMCRAVGNALHKNPDENNIPCYRIVNAKGELSGRFAFGGMEVQKERLEADGIEVVDNKVDVAKYGIDVEELRG